MNISGFECDSCLKQDVCKQEDSYEIVKDKVSDLISIYHQYIDDTVNCKSYLPKRTATFSK